jgi:hypothetical protein
LESGGANREYKLVALWRELLRSLGAWREDWRTLVSFDAGLPRRARSTNALKISNREAFEAFTLALLSGNTRWDRIEAVRGGLPELFGEFDPGRFAELSDGALDDIVHWFRARGAGAARLRSSLSNLRQTAAILASGRHYSSAEHYFDAAFEEAGGSADQVAKLLGSDPERKLPGFGIALAAEGLRNLGFDLCKPDRHVLRAVAAWGLVSFPRWDQRGPFTAPQARPRQLLETMSAVRALAEANQVAVTRANSAIWLAGAVSGARLPNADFASMSVHAMSISTNARDPSDLRGVPAS